MPCIIKKNVSLRRERERVAGSTVAFIFLWRERDKQRPICQKTSLFGLAGQNQPSALSFIPFPSLSLSLISLLFVLFFFCWVNFHITQFKDIHRDRERRERGEGFFCQKHKNPEKRKRQCI
jgi:hypothetical protein